MVDFSINHKRIVSFKTIHLFVLFFCGQAYRLVVRTHLTLEVDSLKVRFFTDYILMYCFRYSMKNALSGLWVNMFCNKNKKLPHTMIFDCANVKCIQCRTLFGRHKGVGLALHYKLRLKTVAVKKNS